MISLKTFFEFDAKKKDAKWAATVVTQLRQSMDWLVSPKRAKENMEFLLGEHDMSKVKAMFKDPDKVNLDFVPIKVMEKLRNIMIAENENAGVKVSTICVDPTATNDKKRDRDLMKNRKLIEAHMTAMQTGIGQPPYSLQNAQLDGKPVFTGNVDKFDEMGLDSNDPDDLDHFFQVHHRLRHEIRAEVPVNHFFHYNKVKRQLPQVCNDILAKKAMAMRCYVNEMTGAIEIKVLAPEIVKVLMGSKPDGSDAQAMGYEKGMSVSEFLELVGNAFNWETDLNDLIRSVNLTNSTEYTGIFAEGNVYGNAFSKTGTRICPIGTFMNLKLTVGYVEWKSIDGQAYKVTDKNYHGNPNVIKVDMDSPAGNYSSYQRETYYAQVTYKALYLPFSTVEQKLYKFGKVAYQERTGGNDEYSCFTIKIYKDVGASAVEVARPFILPLIKAFYKMEWMINKTLPPGRGFNYSALLKVAQAMFDDAGSTKAVSVNMLMKMFSETGNELYDSVTDDEGKVVGGNGQPNYDIKNGLPESVDQLQALINRFVQMINDFIGISPIRDAYAPQERDGYKIQMQSLTYSRNATQYVSRMLSCVFEDVAGSVVSYVQDILRFKDVNSLPYKYLESVLGDAGIEDLESMNDMPLHRYGIFMEAFNAKYDREAVKLDLDRALERQEIDYAQYLLCQEIESPKMMRFVLAYQKRKKEQREKDMEKYKSDLVMSADAARHAQAMELARENSDGEFRAKNVEGEWRFKAAGVSADATVAAANIRVSHIPEHIDAQKNATMEVNAAQLATQQEQAPAAAA